MGIMEYNGSGMVAMTGKVRHAATHILLTGHTSSALFLQTE
jgi:hypothetical protein